MIITKNMYRKALHFYLIHAYPDDDEQYYSKWAWLVSPTADFWNNYLDEAFPFPSEVRFGCKVSVNTKLICSPVGFMFDTNHVGDSEEVIKQVKGLARVIEEEWEKNNIPIHSRNTDGH